MIISGDLGTPFFNTLPNRASPLPSTPTPGWRAPFKPYFPAQRLRALFFALQVGNRSFSAWKASEESPIHLQFPEVLQAGIL